MTVLVVTPPAPLVSLQAAKDHLRYTEYDEDELIGSYVAAASAYIDGPFGILRRAIGRQTLEVRGNVFSAIDRLPVGPIIEIDEVKYIDTLGVEQTLAPENYVLSGERFGLAASSRWPQLRGDASGVRVRYVAGFESPPAPIKQAVLLLVGQWFRHRMAINVGNIINDLPHGVKALLAPYKNWEF